VADTPEAIIYGESLRAIAQQEASLDDLRSRTGTILAAASLITAFLGAQALGHDQTLRIIGGRTFLEPHFGALAWLAVGAFVSLAALCLLILWPWTWDFVMSATVLIEDYLNDGKGITAEELQIAIAKISEENWDANSKKLDRLFWCFRLATLCLALEVLTWLIALGR
jgi:hypothetical protein